MNMIKPPEEKFKAGDVIFSERNAASKMYILREGQVLISKSGKGGQNVPLAIVNSGSYLGEMAIFMDKPHSCTATAMSEVSAIVLSKESIDAQIKLAPVWLVTLAKGLIARLDRANDLLRRNGWVDERITDAISAAEQKKTG